MIDSVQSYPSAERLPLVEQVHGCTAADQYRFGEVTKSGRGWLTLIGVNALVGSGVTLALPTILGRSIDAIVAGDDYGRWFVVSAALIVLGIAASIVDAFAGAAGVAETTAWLRHRLVRHVVRGGSDGTCGFATGDPVTRVPANSRDAAEAGTAVVTTIAAIAPPVGSLVLLAVIDPLLSATFFSGVLLVAVLAVGGLQLVSGDITAGELFAASQYAVLGAGLGNLTGVLGEIARAKAAVQRPAELVTIEPVPPGSPTITAA